MTDDTEELEWPERMYLLHPSVKTFGDMITAPERKEYVRADIIESLRAELRSAELRLGIMRTTCSGLAEQLMKAHTEIAQALGKAGGEG